MCNESTHSPAFIYLQISIHKHILISSSLYLLGSCSLPISSRTPDFLTVRSAVFSFHPGKVRHNISIRLRLPSISSFALRYSSVTLPPYDMESRYLRSRKLNYCKRFIHTTNQPSIQPSIHPSIHHSSIYLSIYSLPHASVDSSI
jgi:hypothetical protein